MAARKPTNPIYVLALPVGVMFGITACAYLVMMLQGRDPQRGEAEGLIRLLENHGLAILLGELALLAVLTITAIVSDDYWTRRFEARQELKIVERRNPNDE